MNIFVLGSSGQIGAPLTSYLRSNGHTVTEFDIVNTYDQDVSNPHMFTVEKLKKADFVYFLAFDVGGSRYLKTYQNTFNFLHNNISLMKNVFEKLQITKTPFIFASSQMSNMTHSSYGVAKKIGELYTDMLNGLTVKFWNVYGYEENLEKSHVITDFILKAKSGHIDCSTNGQESRQFLYVDDCCKALLTLAEQWKTLDKGPDHEYHITSFEWHTIQQVAETIQKIIPCTLSFAQGIDTVQKDSKNEPRKDILKYWSPCTTLEQGIDNITKLYKK